MQDCQLEQTLIYDPNERRVAQARPALIMYVGASSVSEARHAPYVHDQSRLDYRVRAYCWRCAMSGAGRVVRWSTALAVLGVAAVAAVASYEHAYDLVQAHGESGWTG
jgi:hypothetical protein